MAWVNAYSGSTLDRAEDGRRRDVAWVAAQLADPSARAVIATDAGFRVEDLRVVLVPLADAQPAPGTEPVLLGLDADGPVFAVDAGPERVPDRAPRLVAGGLVPGAPVPHGVMPLRDAGGTLAQADGGLLAYAAALLNWHRLNGFCANCGTATKIVEAGVTRACPNCKAEHHPRLDPVVITLVVDGDRALLGRSPNWPPRRYSALAGFVSPAETLEDAVIREVREESGLQVGTPSYRSSQPWPFPASLMLGFTAPYLGGEIGGTDEELEDAAWFTREQLIAAAHQDLGWESPAEGTGILLPPRSAIARGLIDEWLGLERSRSPT